MDKKAPSSSVYISLFWVSCAALTFEINLTRIFSVAQFYHFAFLMVSLALFGFGASGSFLSMFPALQNPRQLALFRFFYPTGAALSFIGSYLLINFLPFDSYSISLGIKQVLILGIHYLALSLPFFFCGLLTASLLRTHTAQAGKLYAANLGGSALGCVLAAVTPGLLGAEGVVVLSSGLAILAAVLLLPSVLHVRENGMRQVLLLLICVLLFFFCTGDLLTRLGAGTFLTLSELNLSPYKSLSYLQQLPDAQTLYQDWNAFSRVDIIKSSSLRSLPGLSYRYSGDLPQQAALLVNGDNPSALIDPDSSMDFTDYMLTSIVYQLRPQAETLILEPQAGLDLLIARQQQAGQITAVESNPLIVKNAASIYGLPGINTQITSGRSFLHQNRGSYDVIQLSLINTYHPVNSGAFSLGEDYRYTIESMQEALEQLNSQGILMGTRWLQMPPSEFLRLFNLALNSLERMHLNPQERMIALRSYNLGLLLVKKEPFSDAELSLIREFASERAFDLVYAPGLSLEESNRFNILQEPLYFLTFQELIQTKEQQRRMFYTEYISDVQPPTDDHPFFEHYFKWTQFPQVLAGLGKSWLPFGGAGYLVLLLLFLFSLLFSVLLILLPLGRLPAAAGNKWKGLFYFGLIGFGYMLVEIPVIQKFILYLDQPVHSVSTVLFSILLFSGLGSRLSGRVNDRLALGLLCVNVLTLPWLAALLYRFSLGLPLFIRFGLLFLLLAPTGFLMGIPFAKGISKSSPALIPWLWGVNGAASVIASVGAAILALSSGFNLVLFSGSVCYAAAWLLSSRLSERVIIHE